MKANLKARSIAALIHLYPASWRREYGEEMEALLATEGLSATTIGFSISLSGSFFRQLTWRPVTGQHPGDRVRCGGECWDRVWWRFSASRLS